MKKIVYLFSCLIITLFFILHYFDLNDKILFKLSSQKDSLINKDNFQAKHIEINEIKKNLSGITYNDKTDTLFAITNSPRDIYELDKQGNILRVIDLKGFNDTEDLTYIKDDLFAVLDEEHSAFYVVKIGKDTNLIDISESIKTFSLDLRNFENFGLEGISYDRFTDTFYLVNEKLPKKIVTVQGFMNNDLIRIEEKKELLNNNYYLGDFSAIHFDEYKNRFYILSDESRLLARVDNKIDFKKYLNLEKFKGLNKMLRPEGFTKDSDENFYIVGEPNIFLSITNKENNEKKDKQD